MDKYYFIKTTRPINFGSLSDLFSNHLGHQIKIIELNSQAGYFLASSDLAVDLYSFLSLISSDYNTSLLVFVSPKNDAIAHLFLAETPINQPGLYRLSELLLAAIVNHNEKITVAVSKAFKDLPYQLFQTADIYIQCGLNGQLASQKLYLHRNTFNYRLNQFVELTGIDIREYWNAQYFALIRKTLRNK